MIRRPPAPPNVAPYPRASKRWPGGGSYWPMTPRLLSRNSAMSEARTQASVT